jgi:beta-glucosidase
MFRIATFNMYQAHGRWPERQPLVLAQLLALRPDLLCLNEVAVPQDTGRWLWREAAAAGLSYAYLQQRKPGDEGEREGQAILSRFPVLESDWLDYRTRNRIAQVARLDVEGAALDVYLTHLHHVPAEAGLRQFQVQQLLAWVGRREGATASVVCGDFNATPDSTPAQLMATAFTASQEEPTFPTGLREQGWVDRGDGEPFRHLFLCLDYVWYRPPLRLVATGRCFDRPAGDDATLWPSDHVGVWADLEIDR